MCVPVNKFKSIPSEDQELSDSEELSFESKPARLSLDKDTASHSESAKLFDDNISASKDRSYITENEKILLAKNLAASPGFATSPMETEKLLLVQKLENCSEATDSYSKHRPYPLYSPPSNTSSCPPSPDAREARLLLSRVLRPEAAESSTWV